MMSKEDDSKTMNVLEMKNRKSLCRVGKTQNIFGSKCYRSCAMDVCGRDWKRRVFNVNLFSTYPLSRMLNIFLTKGICCKRILGFQ